MHSSLTVDVILEESTPVINRGRRWQRTMAGSDRTWRVYRRHIYGESLGNISCACQCMGGGLSLCEVESRRVRHVILTVDAMEDWEYAGHCGGGHEMGGNGSTVLLPCDPFLHQPDISLLLFGDATLRA